MIIAKINTQHKHRGWLLRSQSASNQWLQGFILWITCSYPLICCWHNPQIYVFNTVLLICILWSVHMLTLQLWQQETNMNVTTGLQTITITKHTALISYDIIISSWFLPNTADKEQRRESGYKLVSEASVSCSCLGVKSVYFSTWQKN